MRTLADVIEAAATDSPDAEAIVTDDLRLTYAQLVSRIDEASRSLVRQDLAGRTVFVAPRSLPEAVVGLAGLARAGAVAVPTDPDLPASDLDALAGLAAPSAAIVDQHTPAAFTRRIGDVHQVAVVDLTRSPRGAAFETVGPQGVGDEREDLTMAEAAAVFHTSGTTGAPRGVVHTHASLLRTLRALDGTPKSADGQETWLTPMPPHFIGGFAIVSRVLGRGDRLIAPTRFHPKRVLETVERERVTCLGISPAMLALLVRVPTLGDFDLSSLGIIGLGSSPLDSVLAEQARTRIGAMVVNSYGSTELGGPALIALDGEPAFAPMATVEADIVHDENAASSRGSDEGGELAVRVDSPAIGYLTTNGVTPLPAPDGWLRTGDAACRTDDGRVKLLGRLDNVVFRGGHSVHPEEIEQILRDHPDVRDVAVLGRPSDSGYDTLWAFVVGNDNVTRDELARYCSDRLPAYKRPNRFELRSSLPTASNGKVLHHLLRGELEGQLANV